jgi:hypothetical protein
MAYLLKFRLIRPLLSRKRAFPNSESAQKPSSSKNLPWSCACISSPPEQLEREETMPDLKRRCLLLILGLALPLTLGCSSSLRKAPEPQTTASLAEPKIWRERVGAIPSLDARVTKLVFFASGPADIAPFKEPIYRTRFHHSMTKTVYPEIYLDYPAPGKKVFFTVTAHFRQKGKTIRIVDHEGRIEPNWTMSHHSVGAGILGTGNWPVGNYDVDIHINGEKVATGYFEVY